MRNSALITGSSEGLGKAFAFELASRGTNLVLVSLPGSGLPELAGFLMKNFCVQVHFFEMDLTRADNCLKLFNALQQKQIYLNILVNNAGVGNWSWFEEKSLGFYQKQIELNTIIPVLLSRLFLDQIYSNENSFLLNVGSLGGTFIVPKKQVYGATKSFIRYFTKCLRLELSNTNVSVSLLSPGGISTKPELLVLNHNLKGLSRLSILEPEQVAKTAIDGMFRGKKEIIPGITNRIMVFISKLFPAYLLEQIMKKQIKSIQKESAQKNKENQRPMAGKQHLIPITSSLTQSM